LKAPSLAPPRGFRDILPTEARELRAIERSVGATFALHGYVPLEPPVVEHASATLPVRAERLIRFLDRDGALVVLRPDVTTAVARLVAQRYGDASGAVRVAYFGPVFREEPAMLGAERQHDQAGVELVGPSGTPADAEVLALLAETLARCGLSDATIEIGHLGLLRRFFDGLDAAAMDETLAALRAGKVVDALDRARQGGLDAPRLDRARAALGSRGSTLDDLDLPEARALDETVALARELFPGDGSEGPYVTNLGLVPELPYYTGVVFEGLSPGARYPVAAGGRYDDLLRSFGTPRPAIGFAIPVPRLHLALYQSGWRVPDERALVTLAPAADARATFRVARALRAKGVAVAIGDVAEHAGLEVVALEVVDERTVRDASGRATPVDLVAARLAR
jgi:ATP phosphoribosyltransferase regulatory subunit